MRAIMPLTKLEKKGGCRRLCKIIHTILLSLLLQMLEMSNFCVLDLNFDWSTEKCSSTEIVPGKIHYKIIS